MNKKGVSFLVLIVLLFLIIVSVAGIIYSLLPDRNTIVSDCFEGIVKARCLNVTIINLINNTYTCANIYNRTYMTFNFSQVDIDKCNTTKWLETG
jgi:hypothetical protein